MIDLRSDTFTKPTEAMRKAMYEAEVGDDVYGEDPTMNRLRDMGIEITGKEDALIVSSGCMGNLIPHMIKGGRGKEVLCAASSHIVCHEIGAIVSLSGTLPVIVPSDNGIMRSDDVEKNIHGYAYDMSETSMIEVENTTSGLIYPESTLKDIKKIAENHNLWVHMDGARIFNASVETGIPVKTYASYSDDITFCLSKGLGCPAFSILASTKDFIKEAKRCRKILGGGMRQVGILAAAGIYALQHNVERLRDDHRHREEISKALSETTWADIVISSTNMIFFRSQYPIENIVEAFRKKGMLFLKDGGMGRIVLSMNVSDKDAEEAVRIIRETRVEEF